MDYPEHAKTDRLILRRWRSQDRQAVLAVWSDPDVWTSLRPSAAPEPDLRFAAERFEHHVSHWEEHGFGYWLAEERASGQTDGWFGAAYPTHMPEFSHTVEVGWCLRRPFWGRGLGTEGAAAAIEACFAHLPEDELVAFIHPANDRSMAVAHRLGLVAGGRAYNGAVQEEVRVYRLLRSGWEGPSERPPRRPAS